MSQEEARRDLQHFLRLASAQVRHRIKAIESKETYSVRVARLRMLEELIKEQIPNEDPRDSAGPAR